MGPMRVKVKIENLEREVEVEVGQDLRTALMENDIEIYSPFWRYANCQGKGLCTTCRIDVVEGEEGMSDPGLVEKTLFKIMGLPKQRRRACQTRIYRDAVIRTLQDPSEAEGF